VVRAALREAATEVAAEATVAESTSSIQFNHHQDNIRFSYRCFDRILLNGLIQPFQQPECVVGFFSTPIASCSPSAQLDKLYQRVVQALDELVHAVSLKAAKTRTQTRTNASSRRT
jgi:hypothetical protein